MEAIGLNPIRLDRIGLDPIRVNAIKLGVPGTASGSARPYIDPEVLASLVAVCICDGKSNNDPDRAVIKNLVDPDNPFVISNAAYKLNSGYGGYANDFTTFRNSSHLQVEYSNDGKSLKITSENTKDWWLISPSNGIFSSCRIKVTNCHYPIVYRYTDDGNTYKEIKISEDGIYNLPKSIINNEGVVNRCCFGSGVQRDDYTGLTIEQLPLYEGAFCLDGVDDFVTIPTLAHGGKQVLMKVNLQSYDRYLYDQRNNWSQYLAIVSASKTIAYEYSNKGGKTYIDGILNEHIIDKDLLNITHNITATNANIGVQYAPNIGTSFARGNFAQMALFDFMLFPEISSEEEIKELNEVMGIENNIEVS